MSKHFYDVCPRPKGLVFARTEIPFNNHWQID